MGNVLSAVLKLIAPVFQKGIVMVSIGMGGFEYLSM